MSDADMNVIHHLHVGQRMSYDNNLCTVRYIGTLDGVKGDWLGVEWDDAARGKHDGCHNGIRYFSCLSRDSSPASFVKASRPAQPTRTFVQAFREKYAPDLNVETTEAPIRISGKEVEEVGFAKIDHQLRGLNKLKIVLLDGMRIMAPQASEFEKQVDEIKAYCQSISELDLSRNHFETFSEIFEICRFIPTLRSLRLNGNRLYGLDQLDSLTNNAFAYIDNLELEQTLLTCEQIWLVSAHFPSLKILNIGANQFEMLESPAIVKIATSITTLDLSSNSFTAISDFSVASQMTGLKNLIVNHGVLSRVTSTSQEPRFSRTVQRLELAFNEISTWNFINRLSFVFPGLQSLRISHNPLFQGLQTSEGRPISHENGYLLTVGRIADLKMLNYSTINEKDRLEADTYYLAQIAKELQNSTATEIDTAKEHPRYSQLCEMYGRPDIRPLGERKDPNSLGASLLQATVHCHGSTPDISTSKLTLEIPKRFSLYSTIGLVAQRLGVVGNSIELFWQTEQLRASEATAHDMPSVPWDSDDDDDDVVESLSAFNEIKLLPSTKSIGNIVDSNQITLRAVVISR